MSDAEDLAEVISREGAAQLLQRSGVLWLVMCGHLEAGILPNGLKGVTTASVRRELEWQRTATRSQRIRRSLGNAFQWV